MGRRIIAPRRCGLPLRTSTSNLCHSRATLMPVEPLWRWLREDVTYHHCHATAEDLTRCVAAFESRVNEDPYAIADRLWVKDQLIPDEENCGSQSRRGLI